MLCCYTLTHSHTHFTYFTHFTRFTHLTHSLTRSLTLTHSLNSLTHSLHSLNSLTHSLAHFTPGVHAVLVHTVETALQLYPASDPGSDAAMQNLFVQVCDHFAAWTVL